MPAPNERFHASGGVFPQTVLWDLEVCRPPEPLWNPRLREAATTLCAICGQRGVNWKDSKRYK